MSCGNICCHCYSWLKNLGDFLQSFLLLAIRLIWGIGFFYAGLSKFMNLGGVSEFFGSLGFPVPIFFVIVTALAEMFGGLCLAAGLLSRFVSLVLIFVMVMAYLFAHTESLAVILTDPQMFIDEPPFNYLLASLIVFCFGPGKIALDFFMDKRWCGVK